VRILLDENLPVELAIELAGREVHTVTGLGWAGVTNGELLARAGGQFDVLLTMDSNLEFQQNLTVLPFGVLIIRAPSNRLVHLKPLVPGILAALSDVQPGEVRRIGA
jgi:hypothetical protein